MQRVYNCTISRDEPRNRSCVLSGIGTESSKAVLTRMRLEMTRESVGLGQHMGDNGGGG